jgi:hypothetical protein
MPVLGVVTAVKDAGFPSASLTRKGYLPPAAQDCGLPDEYLDIMATPPIMLHCTIRGTSFAPLPGWRHVRRNRMRESKQNRLACSTRSAAEHP